MPDIIKGYKIKIPKVTGNVSIVCTATSQQSGSNVYTITNNLANCTNSNTATSVNEGSPYSATVTPNSRYELMNISITMGGINITSTVYSYQNGDAVINIPNVTGNVVITVQATETSSGGDTGGGETGGGSDPITGDVLSYMTYGKGINQTTGAITNNPECWATVDPFVVVTGRTYTISCDATWVWVYGFDEADNYTSQLVLGSNENPQNFTFTANSTRIRFGCYDPSHTLTYCNLTESSSSGGESGGSTSYTITRNLTNCTSSNNTSSVAQGAAYSTTVTPNSGSELLNVAITMGGTNVTSSVYTYQNGNAVINIPSVTGNVVITVQASSSSSGGTDPTPNPPSSGGDLTGTYLFFGDSICAGGGSNGYGYPEAVKAKQPSMTAINYAVSGTCIAKNDSYDVNYPSILSRIQGSTPYADYVVLEGGFNDSWGQRNPLGTLKGGSAPTTADAIRSYSASLNAYQYTDALEKCICEIKLKYWDKKIFFVIPHTVDAAVYANTYHSRAIEVCNKWGVIVIDLRNCGMPSHQDGTYNVDGTHPSKAGYDKYFAQNIINVLKANK